MNINYRKLRAFSLATVGIIAIVIIFLIKPDKPQWMRTEGIVWNTEYHITYHHDKILDDSILNTLRRVELSVSPFNKNSLITAINENRADTLDAFLRMLYTTSLRINRESSGAFDPTVSPIINAWGFGFKSGTKPTPEAIDSMMQFVGISKTRLNGNKLTKDDPRTTFNFSAIAKGMGSDEVGRTLERSGVDNFMVEIGGEIVVKGKNPDGGKWRISIDKPIYSGDSIVHESAEIIEVSDCGIATSGNYRNYKTDESGKRYAHTIDPSTGLPKQTDIISSTVIAPNCMLADAYATTFMVLGFQQSQELLSHHPELSVLFILATPDGGMTEWKSPNFPTTAF